MNGHRFRAVAALVCDDVRNETSGKEILIGVFADNVYVGVLPANLIVCLYLRVLFARSGVSTIKFRVWHQAGYKSRQKHLLRFRHLPISKLLPRSLFVALTSRLKWMEGTSSSGNRLSSNGKRWPPYRSKKVICRHRALVSLPVPSPVGRSPSNLRPALRCHLRRPSRTAFFAQRLRRRVLAIVCRQILGLFAGRNSPDLDGVTDYVGRSLLALGPVAYPIDPEGVFWLTPLYPQKPFLPPRHCIALVSGVSRMEVHIF